MEIATFLKDIVLFSAAITGAVVAIKGLGAWRHQLKSQSDYELSRRILVTLLKYRDAINGVRHIAMWTYEIPSLPEDKAIDMTKEQIEFYGTSKAYQARWDTKVQKERTLLYADLLEAEAIWGDDLKTLFKKIFDLEYELATRIRHYLELMDPNKDESLKVVIRKIDSKNRDIMYDLSNDKPDEYKQDMLSAIESIEKYLKPKLSHEKL